LERAELVLRYRDPWFEWSWWFLWTTGYGPMSDYTPEVLSGNQQWFVRNITSRTSHIPSSGMGNTDPMLSYATWDSANYNQLWYHYLESFLLSYDTTSDPALYYTWWENLSFFSNTTNIKWSFRFPPKVYQQFWWSTSAELCDSYVGANCDPDGDGIYDDVAVSRSMEWWYRWKWFKIFPTISVFYYSGMQVDEYKDNVIRESILNDWADVAFVDFTPITNGSSLTKHTVVSSLADDIETQDFATILHSSDYSGLRLSFWATNLFRSFAGAVYPYFEYQFTFPQDIADRFYTIEWQGRVGQYDVRIILKKPTVEWTIGGDFTIIF
jgi:hypothetical protein